MSMKTFVNKYFFCLFGVHKDLVITDPVSGIASSAYCPHCGYTRAALNWPKPPAGTGRQA